VNDQPVLSAKKSDVREELQRINGERARFTARFVRYGRKGSYRGGTKPTVLPNPRLKAPAFRHGDERRAALRAEFC